MSSVTSPHVAADPKRPRLERRFETREAFQDEFRRSIANGGTFIPTHAVFERRQLVDVVLVLEFSEESVVLPAEIVSQVSSRLFRRATSGVEVRFLEPASEVRDRLGVAARLPMARKTDRTRDTSRLLIERRRSRAKAHGSAEPPTQRLTSITGPIEMLDLPNLLQMFSSSAERGTLTVKGELEEGSIGFEGGALLYVRVGKVRGVKALSRLFAWESGTFEFGTDLDASGDQGEPMAIYSAVMEAVTQIDELGRLDTSALPSDATLEIDPERLAQREQDLSESERAVVDFASAESSRVGAILDGLDDFDAAIYQALGALLDAGVARISA